MIVDSSRKLSGIQYQQIDFFTTVFFVTELIFYLLKFSTPVGTNKSYTVLIKTKEFLLKLCTNVSTIQNLFLTKPLLKIVILLCKYL